MIYTVNVETIQASFFFFFFFFKIVVFHILRWQPTSTSSLWFSTAFPNLGQGVPSLIFSSKWLQRMSCRLPIRLGHFLFGFRATRNSPLGGWSTSCMERWGLKETDNTLHSDICLFMTAYENKHLLTRAKWRKKNRTVLRTLRTDFLAWLRFVVLTFRTLCNAGWVDTIHVLHTTLVSLRLSRCTPRQREFHSKSLYCD